MVATVVELNTRSHDQVFHRARNKDVSRPCHGSDPSGNVDGQPSEVITAHLALPGVQP